MFAKLNIQKFLFMILLALAFLTIYAPRASACEIRVNVQSAQKEQYQVGDQLVLKIEVFLTHRNCPEGIDATKYKLEGLKALGATQWKQISPNTYERLIKVEVKSTELNESKLHVVRTCDKEGGYGLITLNVIS